MGTTMPKAGGEQHRTQRIGWLRAAVLGANDGILSTASLVLGVAAAHASHSAVMVAGVAGLVAGSMSMAAGEYVSVHSQADTEQADLELEKKELKADNKGEHTRFSILVACSRTRLAPWPKQVIRPPHRLFRRFSGRSQLPMRRAMK